MLKVNKAVDKGQQSVCVWRSTKLS